MAGLRHRFEYKPGLHTPHPMRTGALVLALFGLFLYWGYTGGNIPFLGQGGYTVRAIFASGEDLRGGRTAVRVGGIDVGTVTGTQRTADGKAVLVTMNITDPDVHLTSNAGAQIYWRTLLGFSYYIQLHPGTGSSPLGDQVIPESRTGVQVELDQVLQALTPTSRLGIRQTFGQLATAFAPGNQAGATIDALAPTMANVGPAIQALQGTGPGDLTNTVYQASRLLSGLSSSDSQLGDLVHHADTTLGATSARQASIDAILQQGPQTLTDTRSTLTRLDATLTLLDPVVDALNPGVRQLAPAAIALDPALRQLIPLLDQARPTLKALRPALTNLSGAGASGTPLLRALLPTLRRLNSTVIPALNAKGSSGLRLYETIGPTAAAVDSSAATYDANGHVQRFQAVAGGANTLSFLPCNLDLTKYKLNCSDLQAVLGELLGGSPASLSRLVPLARRGGRR
jgi:phospholipid/cholesterol/gamma-HCH transport system substrate-binding protein